MWIETEGKRILFDTGQGPALETIAHALGINLYTTDILVLSRGHYDHAGGIAHVTARAPNIGVYCDPEVIRPRYTLWYGRPKSIRIPQGARAGPDAVPYENIHWVQEPTMLTATIGLTGPVPRLRSYEDMGGPFYLNPQGVRPDLIEDDMALWIRTD